MTMDYQQRAKDIVEKWAPSIKQGMRVPQYIAEDIAEAIREASQQGREAGLDEAGQVAGGFCPECSNTGGTASSTAHQISDAIRALKQRKEK